MPLCFNIIYLENEMSVMSRAVYRLNIDYLYQAKIENESLWDLGLLWSLTMPFMMVLK